MTRDLVDLKKTYSHIIDISKPEVIATTRDGFSKHIPKLQKNILELYSDKATINAAIGANSFGSRTLAILAGNDVASTISECKKLGLPIVVLSRNYSEKDCVQIYVGSIQELLDTALQSFSIAESEDVLVPLEIVIDDDLSRTKEVIDLPQKTIVKNLLPNYKPYHITLNPKKPECLNTVEHARVSEIKQEKVFEKIKDVAKEFKRIVKVDHGNGIIDLFLQKSAKNMLITYGSLYEKAKEFLLENKLKDWSVMKIKCVNPFPSDEINENFSDYENCVVLEKRDLALFGKVKSSLKSQVKKIDKRVYKNYEDFKEIFS